MKEKDLKRLADRQAYEDVYTFAEAWVKKQNKSFCSDDMKEEYLKDNPRELYKMIFGNVFKTLQKRKLIKENGFVRSRNKKANGRLIRLWISKEYSERQSLNRSANGENQTKLF